MSSVIFGINGKSLGHFISQKAVVISYCTYVSVSQLKVNFHYDVAILYRPYLELQTSKLKNLGGSGKIKQRSITSI
ncbi:hypothetical protein CR513_12584, partial [Mucuna pruriens]